MKSHSAWFSKTKLTIATSLLTLVNQTFAAEIDKRWFEIEVILFSQLGDKSKLTEQFEINRSLPKYNKVKDLLTPYLYPDLSTLKIQLPSCSDNQYPASYDSKATIPAIHNQKNLSALANEIILTNDEVEPIALELAEQNSLDTNNITHDNVADNSSINTADNYGDTEPELTEHEIANLTELQGLTEHELTLLNQAEQAFATQAFNWLLFSETNQLLCQPEKANLLGINDDLDQQVAKQYQAFISNNHYSVDQLTGVINGQEQLYSDNAYLISEESLKLNDIVTQLRRSRDFKPLLHLGWRQSLINRLPASKATAFRIFAGSHYQNEYQKNLSSYQTSLLELDYLQAQQPRIDQGNNFAFNSENTQLTAELNSIYQAIDGIENLNPEQLAELSLNELTKRQENTQQQTLPPSTLITNDKVELTSLVEPEEPVQPWYIDGLFRVHLSHYLYITADFNIGNMTSGELATAKLAGKPTELTTVSFSQNKRVISTEVHYFDHPYMGMIVQIRRYQKPERPQEDESIEQTNN